MIVAPVFVTMGRFGLEAIATLSIHNTGDVKDGLTRYEAQWIDVDMSHEAEVWHNRGEGAMVLMTKVLNAMEKD